MGKMAGSVNTHTLHFSMISLQRLSFPSSTRGQSRVNYTTARWTAHYNPLTGLDSFPMKSQETEFLDISVVGLYQACNTTIWPLTTSISPLGISTFWVSPATMTETNTRSLWSRHRDDLQHLFTVVSLNVCIKVYFDCFFGDIYSLFYFQARSHTGWDLFFLQLISILISSCAAVVGKIQKSYNINVSKHQQQTRVENHVSGAKTIESLAINQLFDNLLWFNEFTQQVQYEFLSCFMTRT